MKKLYFLLVISLSGLGVNAQQVDDEVTTGPAYQNQVWYSMENGAVHEAPLNNWDLAFEISGFTSSIRVNAQKGITLYQAPYAIAQWNNVDTAGMSSAWTKLYNDPTDWRRGAFNLYPTSDFDLGWGIYNIITHTIAGDSIYVMKLANGEIKKLKLNGLASGTYSFSYANLDGSGEVNAQLVKSQYEGKNFGYYSIEENTSLDREPLSENWDITFTKYVEDLDGIAYPVSGVLHNYDLNTAEVANTPIDEADPWAAGFNPEINTIGYDWKSFDFMEGWLLAEDHSYFVTANNGNVYQIVFTGFSGSATGVYEFTVTTFSLLSTEESFKSTLSLYPNPIIYGNLIIEGEFTPGAVLSIFDISGRMIDQIIAPTANRVEIGIDRYPAGTYILKAGAYPNAEKFIINK